MGHFSPVVLYYEMETTGLDDRECRDIKPENYCLQTLRAQLNSYQTVANTVVAEGSHLLNSGRNRYANVHSISLHQKHRWAGLKDSLNWSAVAREQPILKVPQLADACGGLCRASLDSSNLSPNTCISDLRNRAL